MWSPASIRAECGPHSPPSQLTGEVKPVRVKLRGLLPVRVAQYCSVHSALSQSEENRDRATHRRGGPATLHWLPAPLRGPFWAGAQLSGISAQIDNMPLPGGPLCPQGSGRPAKWGPPDGQKPTFPQLPYRYCDFPILLLLRRRLETMSRSTTLLGCTPRPSSSSEPSFLGGEGSIVRAAPSPAPTGSCRLLPPSEQRFLQPARLCVRKAPQGLLR